MNIFVTDLDPVKAAHYLDDKRVRHMPKECIEMLGIYIHATLGTWVIPFPLWGADERNDVNFLYNHPCSKWVRNDKANTTWLLHHTHELMEEHIFRFDKIHPFYNYFETVKSYLTEVDRKPLRFQNSSLYKQLPVVDAYRRTMMNKWFVTDKVKPVTWTKRGAPYWITQSEQLSLIP